MMTEIEPKTERPRWQLVAFIFAYAVAVKVLPYVLYRMGMDVEKNFAIYPWNFTPIFAICIFGGALYQFKRNAFLLPLVAMFLGDLGIWAVTGNLNWAFYPAQGVVYLAFALCAVLGFVLRENRSWERVAGAGIASCLTFFLITNFASWLTSTNYPQTLAGLIECYAMGLPFLRNSLLATAIFSAILFSPACIRQTVPAKSQPELAPVS